MLVNQTVESLRRMRLTAMAEAFLAQNQDAGCRELCFEERLGLLVDREWTYREDRRLSRLLKKARLKMQAGVEDIDYAHSRGLERSVMAGLSSCQWVRDHQNVLITGPTGVGKTFICCALANLACRNGFSSRYYRLPRLFTDLGIARGDGPTRRSCENWPRQTSWSSMTGGLGRSRRPRSRTDKCATHEVPAPPDSGSTGRMPPDSVVGEDWIRWTVQNGSSGRFDRTTHHRVEGSGRRCSQDASGLQHLPCRCGRDSAAPAPSRPRY